MTSLVNTRMMIRKWLKVKKIKLISSTTQDSISEPVKGRPLYPQHSYVEILKFAEDCNDVDLTMNANFLDNIAKTLDENEYSPRMKSFAFQMQATLRKARRNLKSRISSNKARQNVENNDNDNDGEEERENVSATNEHGRHVMIDPIDDNKCAVWTCYD